jgi:(S)-ureidoglycine aminohydrolase
MNLFGPGRSHVGRDHAFITSDSFVRSPMPGWERTECITLIAPRIGARFTQFLAEMQPAGTAGPSAPGVERVVYVLEGTAAIRPPGERERSLAAGGFVFAPAGIDLRLRAETACRLNVFEKQYVARPDVHPPRVVVGHERDVEGQPFFGDPDARLHVLLPDEPAFDLAVNVFRFKPGAALPFVEVHVMEHGLLMLEGQGVYRLGESWYPVRAGDVIWMAPFCPQWFVAAGKTPAAYLYYKDINRDPLGDET